MLLAGCGDDVRSRDAGLDTARDATVDARVDANVDSATDSAADDSATDSATDSAADDSGADGGADATVDSGTDASDSAAWDSATDDSGGTSDAATDSTGDAFVLDPGPVQCRTNADCPSSMCNRAVPGGVCLACGAGGCPGATSCSEFGACITDCSDDSDCNAAMHCLLGTGRCAIRGCSTAAQCAPYDCDTSEGRCVRYRCDHSACPAPFVCVADVCVEP